MTMTRFPPDIIEAVDTKLSSFYPGRIVDPGLAEAVAELELVLGERERIASWHETQAEALEAAIDEIKRNGGWVDHARRDLAENHRKFAKAIRGKP